EQTADPVFRTLHSSPNQDSTGTVTGRNMDVGHSVHIASKNSNKQWDGKITARDTGSTWKVTVRRSRIAQKDDEQPENIEKVSVTVTTSDATSAPRDTASSVVPCPARSPAVTASAGPPPARWPPGPGGGGRCPGRT